MVSYIQFKDTPYLCEVTDKGTFTRFEKSDGMIFDIENGVLYTEMQLGNFAFINIPNNGIFTETTDFTGTSIEFFDGVTDDALVNKDNSAGVSAIIHETDANGNLTVWSEYFEEIKISDNMDAKIIDFGAADVVGTYFALKAHTPAVTEGAALQFIKNNPI